LLLFFSSFSDFEIWLLAANDLDFDALASVPVTVTCTDGTTPITEDFTVEIFDEVTILAPQLLDLNELFSLSFENHYRLPVIVI
jgi:hypothetical protein